MRVTIVSENLSRGLALVSRVVATRGQLPILANVLLEAETAGLVLAATNLEMGLRFEVGGKVGQPGAITVPAKSLGEFVSMLPDGNVELEQDEGKLKLSSGTFSASFAGIGAAEFPVMPKLSLTPGKNIRIKLKKSLVNDVAGQVGFAAATDESRPVLTGVLVKQGEFVATDGFRLSQKKIPGGLAGETEGLIIPARTWMELDKIVREGKKEEVEMEVVKANNQIVFGYDKTQLVSRLLEGNFPEVGKIIPTDYKTQMTVDREELTRAVRAAAIFARESSNIIRLKISDGRLQVAASATQTGEGSIELEIDKEGEDGEIAFNYRYVLDFLSSVGGERVVFRMSGSLAPGVFGVEGDKSLIHLVMPVRI